MKNFSFILTLLFLIGAGCKTETNVADINNQAVTFFDSATETAQESFFSSNIIDNGYVFYKKSDKSRYVVEITKGGREFYPIVTTEEQPIGVDNNRLYTLGTEGWVNILLLPERTASKMQIPDIDAEAFDKQISDIIVGDNAIYYLKGVCAERYGCELYKFDPQNGTNLLLFSWKETCGVCEITIDDYRDGSVYIASGGGDAGLAAFSLFRFDEAAHDLVSVASYESRYCFDDTNLDCNEEQREKNQDYERVVAARTQFKQAVCDYRYIASPEDKTFLGCYQTREDDWSVTAQSQYLVFPKENFLTVIFSADGESENIALPFDGKNYWYDQTAYGVLFWKMDKEEKTTPNDYFGTLTYRTTSDPQFYFFNGETMTFIKLPTYFFETGTTEFDKPYSVVASTSEQTLLIEIGHYDVESSEFEPGIIGSQPVYSFGLVYHIDTNTFASTEPLTTYLRAIQRATSLTSGMIWDSQRGLAAALPGGEGCGAYSSITFVDLQTGAARTVNGEKDLTFDADFVCNPANAASPDGKWMILSGHTSETTGKVYLFDITGAIIKEKTFELDPQELLRAEKWNVTHPYPMILFSEGTVLDFNE